MESCHRQRSGDTRVSYGNYLDDISKIELRDLTSEDLQLWIQKLSVGRTPKTVRNIYGLISATLDMFIPGAHFSVSLPQNQKKKLYTPSDADVKRLLQHVQGKELEIAILFAAFGPMRRGEICAVTDRDVVGNTVYVNKVYVLDKNSKWVLKHSPKTDSSNRIIVMPDFVIARISGIKGEIVKATPGQISSRFNRAIRFSGLPHFRFHDLRHYCASILHAMNIPDQYIMARGGWATDNVMKRVYFGEISDEAANLTNRLWLTSRNCRTICNMKCKTEFHKPTKYAVYSGLVSLFESRILHQKKPRIYGRY